ncbi:MAG: transcriptional regulator [Nitrospinaceae bacterium]|nr:MAG: transcriptional regulator [Nitrospinaceae bacterium]
MTHKKSQPKYAVHECTCFNLRKATRTVTQLFDEMMQPSGLRATQFTLLAALASLGPVAVRKLSQALVMDRTTLTRNLKPLETQKLVKIVPGEDRRTRNLTLTDKGQKTLKKALPYWNRAQAQVIERLTPKRWKELLKNLDSTIKLLGPT